MNPPTGRRLLRVLARFALFLATASPVQFTTAAEWLRPTGKDDQPKWGLRGGLQFAIPPAGFPKPPGGPRGLIRIGFPILPDGEYHLVNFIAIEPIVGGQKGFSELEHSRLDATQGKRLWTGNSAHAGDAPAQAVQPTPDKVAKLADGVEQLAVTIEVEAFDNGAHVYLVITQRSDRPDEITLAVHAHKDSAPIESCILTATMGNFARARQLWLADEVVSSLKLYPNYRENHFAPHSIYKLDKLLRTPTGDALVAITTDEASPRDVFPFSPAKLWHYPGRPVTQYWKKPGSELNEHLVAAVNARYAYWMSQRPIPGGVSYENFELREPFRDGQTFVFGITAKTPEELGFPQAGK